MACLLPLLAVWSGAGPLAGQSKVAFTIENDAFVSWLPARYATDREYTHGIGVSLERIDAPLWGRFLSPAPTCAEMSGGEIPCLETRFEAGQKLFTPDITKDVPPPKERPYAAWLYGAVEGRVLTATSARTTRVEVGVTGEPALGEPSQRLAHRLIGFGEPRGWGHQLAFEPAVLLEYEARRILEYTSSDGTRIADLAAWSSASVGTLRAGADVGLTARGGYGMPHAWLPAAPERSLVVFGYGRARQRWTLRDLFLDGNAFSEGPSVEKLPFSSSGEVGVAVQYLGLRVTYWVTGETRLYRTQPTDHLYGSIKLSLHR